MTADHYQCFAGIDSVLPVSCRMFRGEWSRERVGRKDEKESGEGRREEKGIIWKRGGSRE